MAKSSKRVVAQVVPYFDKREFEQVMEGLFSDDLLLIRGALDQVAIWESSSFPVMKIGIEATALIVRAKLNERLFEEGESLFSSKDIQMMYSSALIRFVNVVTEAVRNSGEPKSTRRAAAKVGIPEWVVNVRHNCSHSKVPSLTQLRKAVDFGHGWLKKEFWMKEMNTFVDFVKKQPIHKCDIDAVLQNFVSHQCQALNNQESNGIREDNLKDILNELKELMKKDCMLVLEILVAPGDYLSSQNCVAEIMKDDSSYMENGPEETLPFPVVQFWLPLIKLIHSEGHIQRFMELLLLSHADKNHLHQKIAAGLALRLITDYKTPEKERLFGVKNQEVLSFNWYYLLGACVQSCCIYTPSLVTSIFEKLDPPLSEKQKNHIGSLIIVATGAIASPSAPTKSALIFTPDQVKRDLRSRYGYGSIWHEAPLDIDWSKIPIGFVFGEDKAKDQQSSETERAHATDVIEIQEEAVRMEL